MSKGKKKKPTMHGIDWLSILIGAIVDLIVGVLLLLVGKHI